MNETTTTKTQNTDTNTDIALVNKLTRREHKEEEIFMFNVVLCDNETDRDGEFFSDKALAQISKLFVGKTGIFDHNPTGENQTARIYKTEVVADPARKNEYGNTYKSVKAGAYMVRTKTNADLIAEIEGGIKKEVSVSCKAEKRLCSVCGTDKLKHVCPHAQGIEYSGRICRIVLDEITDAYEWSFVAVPAQVEAGVVKRFPYVDEAEKIAKCLKRLQETETELKALQDELKADIITLNYFENFRVDGVSISALVTKMNTAELLDLKRNLSRRQIATTQMQSQMQLYTTVATAYTQYKT